MHPWLHNMPPWARPGSKRVAGRAGPVSMHRTKEHVCSRDTTAPAPTQQLIVQHCLGMPKGRSSRGQSYTMCLERALEGLGIRYPSPKREEEQSGM